MDKSRELVAVAGGSGLPLHGRISDELRRRIRSGELGPGAALPSENDLVATFGVSRGTVRQALATLRVDGLISVRRGTPAIVRRPPLEQPFSELLSFSSWIAGLGMRPAGRVVSLLAGPATADEAEALALEPGTPVRRLVRVRSADGIALMVERTVFAPRIGDVVARLDLASGSIYAGLADAGFTVDSASQSIDAVPASAGHARLLGVPSRTALLRVRRLSFAPAGQPLETSEDRYRGDRVSLTIENSARRPAVTRRLAIAGER
ncbi:MAG TPA: GntR family transcriptional regulator [Candidatus Dormibacteraeota bacterium]|nr:GntR family transcriptional regulator [Candidatus Dormibacteraeota bacterium]